MDATSGNSGSEKGENLKEDTSQQEAITAEMWMNTTHYVQQEGPGVMASSFCQIFQQDQKYLKIPFSFLYSRNYQSPITDVLFVWKAFPTSWSSGKALWRHYWTIDNRFARGGWLTLSNSSWLWRKYDHTDRHIPRAVVASQMKAHKENGKFARHFPSCRVNVS